MGMWSSVVVVHLLLRVAEILRAKVKGSEVKFMGSRCGEWACENSPNQQSAGGWFKCCGSVH